MYKVKKQLSIRIFFLALFLSYFADVTFFTHTHIIHGITIVHSHLYKTLPPAQPDKQTAGHTHSNKALTLISQANAWLAVLPTLPEIPKMKPAEHLIYPAGRPIFLPKSTLPYFQLRAPPAEV